MSNAAPIMIIFVVLIGGVVAWGAMTEWTFSGMLPSEGAKCTPEKDDKDKNATKYVYDEDEECTIIEKCKTGWGPNTSNTVCEYTNVNKECTANTVYIANVDKYASNIMGVCNLAFSCKKGWKPAKSMKSCVADTGKTCAPAESQVNNAKKYTFGPNGKCTLVKECDDGFRVSKDSKSCIDEWVLPTKLEKYQALGYPLLKDGDKEPKFTNSGKETIEECRKEAKKNGAQMFGLRAKGNPADEKSCWYYDNAPIATFSADGNISDVVEFPTPPQSNYWVECVDIKKSAKDFCTK